MIVIGLTGSMAMGKSETARLFAESGIPVFDSDAEVRRLYQRGGAAAEPMAKIVPEAMKNGRVDRKILAKILAKDPELLSRVEALVHPMVQNSQRAFLDRCRATGHKMALLDIPLLFESKHKPDIDIVVVVSAPAEVQRKRLLERAGATQEKIDLLLKRQMPDDEKRRRADYVIDTSRGIESARDAVKAVVAELKIR